MNETQTKNSIENIAAAESKIRIKITVLAEEAKLGRARTTTTARDVARARKQLQLIHDRIQRLESDARRMLESWT